MNSVLSDEIKSEIYEFIEENDFIKMYKSYKWKKDTWNDGFPRIFYIEKLAKGIVRNNILSRNLVISIFKWGRGSKNIIYERGDKSNNIKFPEVIKINFYENGEFSENIKNDLVYPLKKLVEFHKNNEIRNLGPTYLTKIVRFSVPVLYGALDSRIVRVFGRSENNKNQFLWLDLKAICSNKKRNRYTIERNFNKLIKEYSKWIQILSFISSSLKNLGINCPHPDNFLREKLRIKNIWFNADVEMALFSYATDYLKFNKIV